ncbi:MAG TPA: hypothetical protein VIY52_04300 [Streptosporangiaceae bacterium]
MTETHPDGPWIRNWLSLPGFRDTSRGQLRRQQRRSPRERLAQQGRINSPRALDPFDHSRFPGLAHVRWLDPAFRPTGAGDAQGLQPPLVAEAQRLICGDHRVIGVDPVRRVPQPVAAAAARDRDLAPQHHELQQRSDVAVVGPPARFPGHGAGAGKITRWQRPRRSKPVEDVPAARVVGTHPVAVSRPPAGLPGAQQSQVAHHIKQAGWPRAVQELCTHGDAAGVGTGKLVDGHRSRLGDRASPTRGAGLVPGAGTTIRSAGNIRLTNQHLTCGGSPHGER